MRKTADQGSAYVVHSPGPSPANRLATDEAARTAQQHAEAQAEVDARLADQARMINRQLSNAGAVQVQIDNHSTLSVTDVRLVDIAGDDPSWTWRLNPNVVGGRLLRDLLQPGGEMTYFINFGDPAGQLQRPAINSGFAITFRFTDARGTRWERVSKGAPRQVPQDDADLPALSP